jgi:hypothetical protein
MNEQAQRIAIATACGWTGCNWYDGDNAGPGYWNGYPPTTIGVDENGEWEAKKAKHHKPLPDYLNDLNAMHEAEKVLTGPQWDDYTARLDHLSRVACKLPCWRGINLSRVIDAFQIHAGADVKAEAFLRTLNLWKE